MIDHDLVELRQRLLAHLRGGPEERHGFGTVSAKPLDDAIEVSIARHRTGGQRLCVVSRDPPKLLLRLIWGAGQPLTATHFEPGEWLDRLPQPSRAKGEPGKFTPALSPNSKTTREKPWAAR
jgi:hypothetical protein